MNCLNCNNKTSNKYCSRECVKEFKRMKRENLGKDGLDFLETFGRPPSSDNELRQYIDNRPHKFRYN